MKSVVATDSSNNFFVGWTLAGSTWLLTHPDSLKLLAAFFFICSVFCWLNVTFKCTLPPILLMLISFIYTLHDAAFVLYLRQTLLIFWLFKPFNIKRTVSSHFVAKNYNTLYLYVEAVIFKIWKYTLHKRAIL